MAARRVIPLLLAAIALLAAAAPARAQEEGQNFEKLYNDALAQLKAAQDRKNELARENEQLREREQSLRETLLEAQQREAAELERTWLIRTHYVAWRQFILARPAVARQWREFVADRSAGDSLADPEPAPATPVTAPAAEPVGEQGSPPPTPATTRPTTAPAPA